MQSPVADAFSSLCLQIFFLPEQLFFGGSIVLGVWKDMVLGRSTWNQS